MLFYIIFCSVTLSLPHQGLASIAPSPWICSTPVTALNNKLWQEPSCTISGTALSWSGGCYFQLCSSQSSCKKCLFPESTMLWLGESPWRDPEGWDVVRGPVKEPQGTNRVHEDPLWSRSHLVSLCAQLMPHKLGKTFPEFMTHSIVRKSEKGSGGPRFSSCESPRELLLDLTVINSGQKTAMWRHSDLREQVDPGVKLTLWKRKWHSVCYAGQ